MKWFPAIVVNGVSHHMPLCDATIASILGLLAQPVPDTKNLRKLLAVDPALTLWSIWRASIADDYEIRSLSSAAAWLVENPNELTSILRDSAEITGSRPSRKQKAKQSQIAFGKHQLVRQSTLSKAKVSEAKMFALLNPPECWVYVDGCSADPGAVRRHLPSHVDKWIRKSESRKKTSTVKAVHKAGRRWNKLARTDQRQIGKLARQHWKTRLPTLVENLDHLVECILAESIELAPDALPKNVIDIENQADSKSKAGAQSINPRFGDELQQAKLAALKEFAYGASHEINNPLANISSRAQLLMRDEEDEDRRKRLAAINSQAFRAHEMISDLMLFANPPKPQRESCCLQSITASAVEQLATLSNDRSVEVTFQQNEKATSIYADPAQIRVALKAIIQNAIEASEQGQVVNLACHVGANGHRFAEVVVTDRGHGLDERAKEHLFDPYFSGREAGRGLGFGLCKAWRIAELHEGSVDFRSEAGITEFRFRLPLI